MAHFEYGLFFLFLGANVCISGSFYPILYLAVALLHESGHILSMKRSGYPMRAIRFVGFGIAIDKSVVMPYKKEIRVCLAGPLINLLAYLLCMLIYMKFKTDFWLFAAVSNLLYCVLNLLPIAPLDGYKIICDLIWLRYSVALAVKLQKGICYTGIFLLIGMLFCFFYQKFYNFSLIFIVLILLLNEITFLIQE